ncbi:hypothetical protein [Telluribacter sp.]|jgi:hypothetical protein|uniref:hypothetical protein n=1 Tax=Telluribacter sp. TaxID=1978767 RepID=UPI002E129902|nr:hypothetical protein [Telluribacter sp.]
MLKDLNLNLVLVPFAVLILVVLLYLYLYNKAGEKSVFKQLTLRVVGLAFLLNLIWELAQGPLYEGYVYDFQHIAFCALASVADAIMVVLLYFSFALVLKDSLWIKKLSFLQTFLLLVVGGAGAILAEIRHTAAGNWAYAETMPLVPLVNVGLSPVLQFTLLPVVIYVVSFR